MRLLSFPWRYAIDLALTTGVRCETTTKDLGRERSRCQWDTDISCDILCAFFKAWITKVEMMSCRWEFGDEKQSCSEERNLWEKRAQGALK